MFKDHFVYGRVECMNGSIWFVWNSKYKRTISENLSF
ncbi:hypothetical protein ES705_14895 [subsurface metagenome]